MTAAGRPNSPLPPTGWQTVGPFFPRTFFHEGDNDLTRRSADAAPSTRGQRIRIHGRVLEQDGRPCVNAVLEAWQADAAGRFRHPHDPEAHLADPDFLGWGRAWTDAEGHYEFRSLLPGAYRDRDGAMRAAHVNIAILASGVMAQLTTVLFFPEFAAANVDDPVLRSIPDPALRALLVAREEASTAEDGERVFRFDILVNGDAAEETPFFEE